MNTDRPEICDYEGSDYQSRFWDQGGREYEDRAEAVALKRLLPKSGRALLELGAGAGRHTPRYVNFERVVLLDYSRTQLKQAQDRLGVNDRYLFVAGDVYKLPFVAGLFDTATMIRTIHHLSDPSRALNQARRVLQSGSTFILEYANKHNLKAILRYLLGQQSWSPFTRDPIEFVEYNFNFHPRSIQNWLTETQFAVRQQLTVSHFRIESVKKILPLNLLVNMDSVMQRTGGLFQLTPSVFVQATSVGETPTAEPGTFFRCVACGHSPLDQITGGLQCPNCEHFWAFEDGIYDFRLPTG